MEDKKRFSVSLLYDKPPKLRLRVFITTANSEQEALGAAIMEFMEEMKDYQLITHVVVEIICI